MPRRKRSKTNSPTRSSVGRGPSTPDAVARFAAALRESEERDRAEHERERRRRENEQHLAAARQDLEHAIAAAREARRRGRGVAEADEAWRDAKARVIELETGEPPEWAPPTTEDGDERDDRGDDDTGAGDRGHDDTGAGETAPGDETGDDGGPTRAG